MSAASLSRDDAIPFDYVPQSRDDLIRCLADPMWRVCSGQIYQIMVKSPDDETLVSVVPFRPNLAQLEVIENLHTRNVILKARQLGFCVHEDTRVLTASLRWVRIGDVKPGDEMIAVDEFPPGGRGQARRLRTTVVEATRSMQAPAFRISFDDGREIVCTDQHPWLSKKAGDNCEWRSLSGRGHHVVGRLKVGKKVRWIAKPWSASSVEDGWFGGMLDGEGSIAKPSRTVDLNVSQRPGPVWDRLVQYARTRGYNACIEDDSTARQSKFGRTPAPKLSFGRADEIFRLIGQTRPTRFIHNRWWEGRELPGKRNGDTGWSKIVSIEAVGNCTVVDLQTAAKTYIAEGFVSHNTTLICILWLDHALFVPDQRCGIVAHTLNDAETIFRDKVKFAYENLPGPLRELIPTRTCTSDEIVFNNNSSIRVAVSMRSGTLHRLHVSELGKLSRMFPKRAAEVFTGSLQTVPFDGVAVIESTAEGQAGEFYDVTQTAMRIAQSKKQHEYGALDWRLFFFPWWQDPTYALDPAGVAISPEDERYFADVEGRTGARFTAAQKAWYVTKRDLEFFGQAQKMWQEYPSYADEAFKVSAEAAYYRDQLAAARRAGRIGVVPHLPGLPVNTFWDIGSNDGTGIWLHQRLGMQNNFIRYIEGWGEPYSHFVQQLQSLGYVWGAHFLPHDAAHKRQMADRILAPIDMLESLWPGARFEVVPPVAKLRDGIQATRDIFPTCWFDEANCKEGLIHLAEYKRRWNTSVGGWTDEPVKDVHTEGADALRQFAQAAVTGARFSGGAATQIVRTHRLAR